MERTRFRKPSRSQDNGARPVDPVLLAPAANSTPPEREPPIPKHAQTRGVAGNRGVVEVGLHDRLEPLAGLAHGIVHPLTELLLSLSQLRPHAFTDRLMRAWGSVAEFDGFLGGLPAPEDRPHREA